MEKAGSGPAAKEPRYLAIEGPIGVGKTSLAERVAEVLGARLVKEPADENPFLPGFYQDPRRYAFPAQVFFLLNRYRQQQELAQQDLFAQSTVADYLFDKDRIFAHLNLSDSELELYEQIYGSLNLRVVRPDLVIYLQARPKVLLERIKRRATPYEKNLDLKYLERLSAAYGDYFFYYNQTPLLSVDTSEIDFLEREEDFQALVKEIKTAKGGTQHFNPLGSR
ncbi:MAG: deoxyadenosine kinase [Deltaproteobacteria bacterium RBG_13_61_14]|nr:MAG: deoxyadenosine kinase [Deltaproteobacteria bacterium RBG_13_61_14]